LENIIYRKANLGAVACSRCLSRNHAGVIIPNYFPAQKDYNYVLPAEVLFLFFYKIQNRFMSDAFPAFTPLPYL